MDKSAAGESGQDAKWNMYSTAAMRSIPTAAMKVILNLSLLHTYLHKKKTAKSAVHMYID